MAHVSNVTRRDRAPSARRSPRLPRQSGDDLRELAALPRQRRLALVLDDEPARAAAAPRTPRRARAGGPGSAASRSATTTAGHSICSSACRSANGRDRGTTSSASATASRCAWRAMLWRTNAPPTCASRPAAGRAGARRRSLDPVAPQRRRERVVPAQALVAFVGNRVVRGRDDESPATRSGTSSASRRSGVRAHRRAREHGALELELVEHGEEVRRQRVVAVRVARRRGRRRAVAARVVCDRRGARCAAARASP